MVVLGGVVNNSDVKNMIYSKLTTLGRKVSALCTSMPWFFCFVLLVTSMGGVKAQSSDALSIKIGEANLTPIVRLDYISNSNAFLTPDAEVETIGFVVSPSATLRADRRLLALEFGYEGAYGNFNEDALNYEDHRLFATARAELGARTRLAGNFSVSSEHEDLGVNFTRSMATEDTELVESILTIVESRLTYGAQAARGNIAGGLTFRNRGYQTQDDLTSGRDFSAIAPFVRFTYRLSVDTRALVELRFSRFDFDDDVLDRSDVQVLTGFEFRGSGRLGGDARLGVTTANFSEDVIEDTTLLSANINMYFLPTTFSRIDLKYTREFDNTNGLNVADGGEQATRDLLTATWSHQWSVFVNTRAFITFDGRNRDCPVESTTTGRGGFEIGLKPRRWIEFGAGIDASQRTADTCPSAADVANLDFERQIFNVFTRISL